MEKYGIYGNNIGMSGGGMGSFGGYSPYGSSQMMPKPSGGCGCGTTQMSPRPSGGGCGCGGSSGGYSPYGGSPMAVRPSGGGGCGCGR